MKKHCIHKALVFGLFAIGALAVFSFVVMLLWNWLMPSLFELGTITFWQSAGILVLAKLLFGGLYGRRKYRKHSMWKKRLQEKLETMTPEEREKFKEGMRGHCAWNHGYKETAQDV